MESPGVGHTQSLGRVQVHNFVGGQGGFRFLFQRELRQVKLSSRLSTSLFSFSLCHAAGGDDQAVTVGGRWALGKPGGLAHIT